MTDTYQGGATQAHNFQPVSWYHTNCILFRIGEIYMGWYAHTALSLLVSFLTSLCRPGDSTFAAITAVFAANIVLVAYIVTSLRDDQAEREAGKPAESRKDR